MDNTAILNTVKQVQKGDKNAFATLVDVHKDMVYSLCFKMTQSADDAEDIAQDSFIKAYQSIRQFKGQAKFSTWLYRITYFTAINFLRKNKINTTNEIFEQNIEADPTILNDLEQNERKIYLDKAFTYLTPSEKAIISLFYLKENSVKEIAEITGLSESNIKVKIHRIRKKLLGILQKLLKNDLNSLV